MKHQLEIRVYYEDTDMGGIVYYANYLKFLERGRSDQIREMGVDQKDMKSRLGVIFAVKTIKAEYHKAAVYEDVLRLETEISQVAGAKFFYDQNIYRQDELIFSASICVVCIAQNGRPTRIPADIRQILGTALD